nr:MAG TPA: hypothetical protein [Caudoviricetes sp.]
MAKKFIKTTDEKTANKLLSEGFKLISQIGNVYTFLNDVPENFNFDMVDEKKIVYDNKLSL